MTQAELDILCSEELRIAIERNIERTPEQVALDRTITHARLVASQIKNLKRAATKHPRLYAARCIIPDRAIEQSSSSECAQAKRLGGESLLDITCGLGGDAIELSHRFRRVVALERDEVLANIVRENLRRLGIDNVEVINCSAEEYLAHCTEHFSAIIADPDRRVSERRGIRLEDCSPNVIELMPRMRKVAEQIVIKCSPMFDVAEAHRLFPDASTEVVSLRGECKEVNIYIGTSSAESAAHAIGRGRFSIERHHITDYPTPEQFMPEQYHYLITPDVALQKARLVRASLEGIADCWSENSFAFAKEQPSEVVGRVEEISSIEPVDWRALKRRFSGRGVDIVLRDTPLDIKLIHKKLGTHSGDEQRLAFTRICGENYCIILNNL